MSAFCLDSWAVLRWLEGAEPAASRVDEVLPTRPVMSWMNVGEVYYVTMRRADESAARDVLADLRAVLALDEVGPERIVQAATIKARHPVAYADAFAIATAVAHDAVLLTGDPEIVATRGQWTVEDLR